MCVCVCVCVKGVIMNTLYVGGQMLFLEEMEMEIYLPGSKLFWNQYIFWWCDTTYKIRIYMCVHLTYT